MKDSRAGPAALIVSLTDRPHENDSPNLPDLPPQPVFEIVRSALQEDMPWGDVTSDALLPWDLAATGRFVVKAEGMISGLAVAAEVFRQLDPRLRFTSLGRDGGRVQAGSLIAEVRGPAHGILAGERTALNFLQRMSGIATMTSVYVQAVAGTNATITDTRKTMPGLRLLDKYAVRCGGGSNHRFSLSDAVLVKDNHIAALGERSLVAGLRAARRLIPHTVSIEVEVDRLDQIEAALAGGADIILLDNMELADLSRAVAMIGNRARTEASGGVSLESVRRIAETGVDLISVGALTHSVHSLDISLELTINPAHTTKD
jgi:nicotinate-nucleotide pyrophosphorylase (carboxylating)